MALRIYIRQHSPDCLKRIEGRIAAGEIQPLTEKDLKDYRHCKCGWWMYGTSDHGAKHKPHALGVFSYKAADDKRKEANKPPQKNEAAGLTVKELWEQFMAAKKRAEGTQENYNVIGNRLLDFCQRQNPPVERAADITPTHCQKLRAEWEKLARWNTVNNHLIILKTLFNYAVKMHLITVNPASPVAPLEPPRATDQDHIDPKALRADGGEESNRTLPLDPEGGETNYRKLIDGIEPFFTGKLKRSDRVKAQRRSNPFLLDTGRYSLLLQFMYETGLRISDAMHVLPQKFVLYEKGPVEIHGAKYTTRQIKTGDPVTVFFPVPLAKAIQALPVYRNGYVFFDGSQKWKVFRRATIGRSLAELGEAVGLEGVRCHRFRDSFAVNRLNEDMTFERLAELLGHKNVQTTRDYYNPWVESREENSFDEYIRARQRGAEKAAAKATGKVVPITRAG